MISQSEQQNPYAPPEILSVEYNSLRMGYLEGRVDTFKQRIKVLNQEQDNIKKQIDITQVKAEQAGQYQDKLKQKLENLDKLIRQKNDTLQNTKKQIQQLSGSLNFTKTNDQLQITNGSIQANDTEIFSIEDQISQLQYQRQSITFQIELVKSEIQRLGQIMIKEQSVYQELILEIKIKEEAKIQIDQKLKSQFAYTRKNINRTKDQIKPLKQVYFKHLKSINSMTENIQKLEKTLESKRQQKINHSKNLDQLQKQVNQLQTEIQYLKNERQTLGEQFMAANLNQQALQSDLTAFYSQSQLIASEIKRRKDQITTMQEQLDIVEALLKSQTQSS